MAQNLMKSLVLCAVIAVMLALGGCLPNSVTISLGGQPQDLEATAVMGEGSARVAMIDLDGLISHSSTGGLIASSENPVDKFLSKLEIARNDDNVQAVILRINSPGGTVVASELLYREVVRFREETGKPVIASLGEVATSGGYYVALACDEIVGDAGTITGSIGVVIQTLNMSEGLGRLGVRARSVVSGPNKALASPLEPADETHYAILQEMVDEMYGEFVARVRERRAQIDESVFGLVTDGRIFTGSRAHDLGVIDSVGGLPHAFERAKALASIEDATLIKYHREGAVVRTAYAMAGGEPGVDSGGMEFGVRARVGSVGLAPGRAYFVWQGGVGY